MTLISADQIRLICFDVDHTLLTDQQKLTQNTERVLRQIQTKGIKIILATGKNLAAIRPIVDKLKLDDPHIFANGSLIQYPDGGIVYQRVLPPQQVRRILELGDEQRLDMMLYVTNDTFVKKSGRFSHVLDKYGGPKPGIVADWSELGEALNHILKIVFIHANDHCYLENMELILKENIKTGIVTCQTLPILLEVQPTGVNKGAALERVARILKFNRESLLAFGDGNNDLEMLQYAGLGVALENATPELKMNADHIVPSNNDEGPAEFLKRYFNLQ